MASMYYDVIVCCVFSCVLVWLAHVSVCYIACMLLLLYVVCYYRVVVLIIIYDVIIVVYCCYRCRCY